MNSFATLALIYAIFTLISSAILYASFRKKIDISAVYFLISELLMAITCGVIFLINVNVINVSPIWTAIPNFSALGAEISILFSILAMTRKISKRVYASSLLATGLIAIFFELVRSYVHVQIIILMFVGLLTCLYITNYIFCRYRLPVALSSNEFMKLFTWFELGMVFYGLLRLLANSFAAPLVPRDAPTDLAVLAFSFYVVLGAFRYISYIGLRITWVDAQNPTQNLLNKPLAKAIEEKDQLLRGLIASNRVIGISALASSLAHQLSQPLTTIALRADTTRRALAQKDFDPRVIASLDEISAQSTKLSELVKNLRQLFGSRSYQFEPINLQKIANEIIEIVEPTLESNKITLTKSFQGDPTIYGDGIQLQQVLINVFNNAIDVLLHHKSEHKEISINITSHEKFAILTIKDSGLGISSQLLPSIFELYKTTKQGGLGVGLWLSKTIMERHHGSITAFNDESGGAIFKIEIPMHRNLGK